MACSSLTSRTTVPNGNNVIEGFANFLHVPRNILHKMPFWSIPLHLKWVRVVPRYLHQRISPTHSAVAKPWKIIWVDPNNIRYLTSPDPNIKYVRDPTESIYFYGLGREHPYHAAIIRGGFHSKNLGCIVSGEWDQSISKFEDIPSTVAIKDYLMGDVPWDETDYYHIYKRWIKRGYRDRPKGYMERYRQKIDELDRSIRENGFLPQRELGNNFFDNILINIGRNGELLFNTDGHHRLAIAQARNIEEIPVGVIARHTLWQQKRDSFNQGQVFAMKLGEIHPDLKDLSHSIKYKVEE